MQGAVSAILVLFATTGALQPRQLTMNNVSDAKHVHTIRESHAAMALNDGSEWMFHPCPAKDEPSCMAVTRLTNGEAKPFIAADFLPGPAGATIPIGKGGQIYSITDLDDGRKVVSLGWNDGKDSHNALVYVTFSDRDHPTIDRVVEMRGVRAIVGATQGRVLAATMDALIPGGGPRLTLLDGAGKIVKQWLPGDYRTPPEAARAANDVRLQEVIPGRYAFFDPSDLSVRILDLPTMTFRSAMAINDDLSGQSIRDFYIAPNNVMAFVTTGRIDGRFRTSIHVYAPDGNVVGKWTGENPWQTVVHHGHVFTGTIVKDDVTTETVDLSEIE